MLLTRTQVGFVPANDGEAEKCRRVKLGATIRAEVAQMRNARFFRKWWALANLAYEVWADGMEPQEYKGIPVRPNFERFRKDLIIMTGHYTPVYNVRGECRLEADSLKFGSMDEETFEKLFSETITVILQSILKNSRYDEASLRATVDEVCRFA